MTGKSTVRSTLGSQTLLLLLISAILLAMITFVSYGRFRKITTQQSKEYFSTIFDLVEGRVSVIVNNMELTTQMLSSNSILQRYLSAKPEYRHEYQSFVQNLLVETVLYSAHGGSGASTDSILHAVYLLCEGTCIKGQIQQDVSAVYEQIMEDYQLNDHVYYASNYSCVYQNGDTGSHYYAIIQPIKYQSAETSQYSNSTAYCIYFCNADLIQRWVFPTEIPDEAMLYLYDYNYRTVAASNPALIGESLLSRLNLEVPLNRLSEETQEISYNGEPTLVHLAKVPQAEWTLLLLIPNYGMVSDINAMFVNGVWISLVTLVVMFLVAMGIIRRNMREVAAIVDGLGHVEGVGNHYRLPVSRILEFGQICSSINKMLEQLERSLNETIEVQDRLHANEILKKNAQMYALQTQINPHFLYNTLGCISSMARNFKIPGIEQMTGCIASIFRYCIRSEEFVSLAEELKCVEEYLKIMSIRFPGKMQFFINISKPYLARRIPKMILQPVVENAIQHGLCTTTRMGILSISCKETAGAFQLIIKDNGIGIPEERLKQLCDRMQDCGRSPYEESGEHIGLINIHARLIITYGDGYGVVLTSKENKGTTVTLRLPLQASLEAAEQDKKEQQEDV